MSDVGAVLIVIGAAFCAIAGLGLLRLPDVFTRLHAASKAGPLGGGLILVGMAVASGDWAIVLRALLGVAFLIGTTPVGAHLLARAALHSGQRPDARTNTEDLESNQ